METRFMAMAALVAAVVANFFFDSALSLSPLRPPHAVRSVVFGSAALLFLVVYCALGYYFITLAAHELSLPPRPMPLTSGTGYVSFRVASTDPQYSNRWRSMFAGTGAIVAVCALALPIGGWKTYTTAVTNWRKMQGLKFKG